MISRAKITFLGSLPILVLLAGLMTWSGTARSSPQDVTQVDREPSSMAFPRLRETSDTDEILAQYPAYLDFVLEVARFRNPGMAKRLAYTYSQLRRRDPDGAAMFLRGLRFEMVYKLELMGASPGSISTRTPKIRDWVAKFLPDWWREADEGLFRSLARR